MTNFHEIASKKGWSNDERIDVLLRYIENQGSDQAFSDFLAEQDGLKPGEKKFIVTALWPENGSWEEDVVAEDEDEAGLIAKETMADNACIAFEDDEQRKNYMDNIEVIYCGQV